MRSLPTEKVAELIDEADKEWPEGGLHLQTIVSLKLLLDIRETLIEVKEKINALK